MYQNLQPKLNLFVTLNVAFKKYNLVNEKLYKTNYHTKCVTILMRHHPCIFPIAFLRPGTALVRCVSVSIFLRNYCHSKRNVIPRQGRDTTLISVSRLGTVFRLLESTDIPNNLFSLPFPIFVYHKNSFIDIFNISINYSISKTNNVFCHHKCL